MTPIPYADDQETVASDEAETIATLVALMGGVSETTLRDTGHAMRSAHAKSHGLLRGTVEVLPGLPGPLAQGMFAQAATYPCAIRLSTTPGDILGDRVSTPRGFSIKIAGVPGEPLPGAGPAQSFVLVDWPAFVVPDPKSFVSGVRALAATTDRGEGLKRALSAVLRGVEHLLEEAGHPNAAVLNLGGHPETHILGCTFHTQLPHRHGAYVAKYSMRPASANLRALRDARVDLHDRPNGLREAVAAFFADQTAEWELCAQLRTDAATMPIEDATAIWPEAGSPHVPVARVSVGPQPSWTPARVASMEDDMAFSPWLGLAAHRPLGGVMRARRDVYAHSAQFRGTRNGCPMREPDARTLPL